MKIGRRQFLERAVAAAATVTIVPRHVLGGPRFVPPSDKVNVALVGAGGQGRSNIRELFKLADAQVIAVADACEQSDLSNFYYRGTGGRKPVRAEIEKHYADKTLNFKCNDYEDFRVMLEKEKSIDAILCATPDHLHAYVSAVSMRAGKHVYCEKPLTHNVWEARAVARIAKETGVATQLGNQGHANEGIRQTCEWIWDGAIGTVNHVHAWVGSSRWNKSLVGRPTETPPVPSGLNWDLWQGPRAERPYHPAYVPVAWRDFWAYGLGTLGDFGCHDLDSACWALDLVHPRTIEATPAGYTDADIQPHGEICHYRFDEQGKQKGVRVTWYGGGIRPETPDAMLGEATLSGRGVLFVGNKGVILCGGAGGAPKLFPKALDQSYTRPKPTIARPKGHHRDWLDACKGGAPASSNFEYGARLTEIVLLGVASLRLGKPITFDAAQMKAVGVPEADPIFKEPVRTGWEIP